MAKPGKKRKRKKKARSGKLRIADQWNAISIIASSQANPLKAVAEFVENSIDARAGQIVITRGKKKGEFYLQIIDDGEGILRNEEGLPDFRHMATHNRILNIIGKLSKEKVSFKPAMTIKLRHTINYIVPE